MSYTPVPSKTDDAAFTIASDQVSPVGYLVDETSSDSADEGDVGIPRMNAKRIALSEIRTPTGDTAMDDVNDALRVNVVAGSGSLVQYTEGDTDASITGNAILWEDTGDTLRSVSAAKPLPVGDAGGSLTVDDGGTTLSVDDGGGSITVDGPLTDTQLRATPVPVSGTVTITDGSGPVTVDGAVTVSGTATVSGTVSVDSITTSVTPGTAAANLGKAEDAPHNSGDTGVMGLTVRKDTAAATATTDGDYQPAITDATGRTWVNTEMPDAALMDDTFDSAATPVPTVGAAMLGLTQGATTCSRIKAHDQQLDARSNLINGLAVNAYGYCSNGSAGERNRTANGADGTAGTGVPAAGQMVWTGSTWVRQAGDSSGMLLPGTGASNLGKAEDAAHASGDTGVMSLAVRNDAGTVLAGATGDYIPLSTDSVGNLRVNVSALSSSDLVTNCYGYDCQPVYDPALRSIMEQVLLMLCELDRKLFSTEG